MYGIAIRTFVMVGSQRACEPQRRGVNLQGDTRLCFAYRKLDRSAFWPPQKTISWGIGKGSIRKLFAILGVNLMELGVDRDGGG